ncbi:MAG: hypothetical protein JSS76_19710, partial [Bacteroidetes bacterium]|nr:hypothetical protein [Bacteroidota bacterium]
DGSEYYDCKFVEDRSDVIFEKIDIHIFTDAIGFNWDVLSLSELIYYRIADKVYIGVDDNYYLKSFYINGLKQEDINAILGLDL